MEIDEPVHEGYLYVPPCGKKTKKQLQKKYCQLYKSGKFGISRIEIFNTDAKTGQANIITLENIIKISPKLPTGFSILTKTAEYEFTISSEDPQQSEDYLNNWLLAVQKVVFPDDTSQVSTIEQDNDLYCPSTDAIYNVILQSSEVSIRCNLIDTNYILVLTRNALQLLTLTDHSVLFFWPYYYIRKYGIRYGRFYFEAGRKCTSGEGVFYFKHSNCKEIYKCLNMKMKSMKRTINSESMASVLDCGFNQLHAALNMGPRSRSPLPPSPTFLLSSDSAQILSSSYAFSLDESVVLRKPMIRTTARKQMFRKFISEESIATDISASIDGDSKYDTLEFRSDAWKTMGVENPKHVEQSTEAEDDEHGYISCDLIKSVEDIKLDEKSHSSTVLGKHVVLCDKPDDEYDHLDHFGTCSKFDIHSGYKQVLPTSTATNTIDTNLSGDYYDEVQLIEPARSADDSHLGYAKIRKDPNSGTLKEVNENKDSTNILTLQQPPVVLRELKLVKNNKSITHQFHNEEPYALISKPKRV